MKKILLNLLGVATIVAITSCGGDKDEDNSGNGGNGGGGKPPVELPTDKRGNTYVEDLIRNYVVNTIPKLGLKTEQEVLDLTEAFVKKTLYIGKEDSIKSNKLAFISAAVTKAGNPNTFDHTQAMVKVTTGNGEKRAGTPEITIPYNPSIRSFCYDYEIKNVENAK